MVGQLLETPTEFAIRNAKGTHRYNIIVNDLNNENKQRFLSRIKVYRYIVKNYEKFKLNHFSDIEKKRLKAIRERFIK